MSVTLRLSSLFWQHPHDSLSQRQGNVNTSSVGTKWQMINAIMVCMRAILGMDEILGIYPNGTRLEPVRDKHKLMNTN